MQRTSVQKQKKSKKIGGFSMFKKMKHMKNEKGLTLIELLAVIVILAIIAAIAIPAIGNIINNTRDKATLSEVQSALSSAKIAKADGSCSESSGTVTCLEANIEFESEKVDITSIIFKPEVPAATPGGTATAATVEITATIKPLSGKRIPETLNSSTITDNVFTEVTAASGTPATSTLKITEKALNEVLGN